MAVVDPWLLTRLACPYDGGRVRALSATLACTACNREYAVVEGIPVMLRDDVVQTHSAAASSLAQVQPHLSSGEGHREAAPAVHPASGNGVSTRGGDSDIDPFVQQAVGATCGLMYLPLMGRLASYPIPELRAPGGAGTGRTLLDVGCNWGRWSIAAARAGYVPIGVDPMLGALRAAGRVSRQLGLTCHFVTGDARYLPLRAEVADVTFSYSVLQHMAKHDVRRALREMRRVLRSDGVAVVQMPNRRALRSLTVEARRGFRRAAGFEVRYWTVNELRTVFERLIGPTSITVDGFFSLNPQAYDVPRLPLRYRMLVRTSEGLRRASDRFPWLANVADSVYVTARVD